jgi:hypothetical protein
VLNLTKVAGSVTNPRNCRPTSGRIEVCNAKYGSTGWLGVAQIWASGSHITQAVAKMNDTYFNTAQYNTPAWRRLVMCQEIAHDFGLDHQDENFNNANLGTCMDYTSDPDGPPSNEHPNQHDYDQLVTIYSHLDSTTTIGAMPAGMANGEFHSQADWGQAIATSSHGKPILFERDFGNGYKMFTLSTGLNRPVSSESNRPGSRAPANRGVSHGGCATLLRVSTRTRLRLTLNSSSKGPS